MKISLVCVVGLVNPSLAADVWDDLLQLFHTKGPQDIFLQFKPFDLESRSMRRLQHALTKAKPKTDAYAGIQEFSEAPGADKGARLQRNRRGIVAKVLREHARLSQRTAIEELTQQGARFKSFWINNSILVYNAPFHLLQLFVDEVKSGENADLVGIEPNKVVARIPPLRKLLEKSPLDRPRGHYFWQPSGDKGPALSDDREDILWNLRLINADKVWPKSRGEGVVIGSIDTGVNFMHPLLREKYRGHDANNPQGQQHSYNWFDPEGRAPFPRDVHGHGTHTVGTMVGDLVGVAPNAKWIAAQGCGTEQCTQEHLVASAQWIMCPSDDSGSNERCDLGADIVNNSWGGEPAEDSNLSWFLPAAKAWVAAGMIPIFAIGNSGPDCGSAGTPGDLEQVIGVGSIDQLGSLSFFSSRGPGVKAPAHAQQKPDWVAPGQSILSCGPSGNTAMMSGTSMAAPHVSGVAALLRSIYPALDFHQFRRIVVKTCNILALRNPQFGGQMACGNRRWDEFPNFQYGHGLIDAEAAARALPASSESTAG